jgi:hypothetical protein
LLPHADPTKASSTQRTKRANTPECIKVVSYSSRQPGCVVQAEAGINEQGVGVPPHVVLQLQPCCPTQLSEPVNRLQGHDEPVQEFVAESHMHPWMLMQE